MALDKLVDSTQLDSDLTSVANAIRTKGGTSAQLAFPADFVTAINAISGGGTDPNHLATGVDICFAMGSADWQSNKPVNGINGNLYPARRALFCLDGTTVVYYAVNGIGEVSRFHLIPIPQNATKVTVTINVDGYFAAREYVESGGSITSSIATTGWTQISADTGVDVNLNTGTSYLTVMFKADSGGSNFTPQTLPNRALLDFS